MHLYLKQRVPILDTHLGPPRQRWRGPTKMRPSIFASLLALFMAAIPLSNVYAEKGLIESQLTAESADTCRATYSVEAQTLTMPCVEVSGESVSYALQMEQVAGSEALAFSMTEVVEQAASVNNGCQASYALDSGKLSVPCVDIVNPSGDVESREMVLWAQEGNLVFVIGDGIQSSNQSGLRTPRRFTRSCPSSSDYIQSPNQGDFTRYGYQNPLDGFVGISQWQSLATASYRTHLGVDYMTPAGSNVYSICDGTVTGESQDFTYQQNVRNRNFHDSYFNSRVIVRCNAPHGSFLAIYGHVDKQSVTDNTQVYAGQKIAEIAPAYKSSGARYSANDHLHFGIKVGSSAFNWGFGIAPRNTTLQEAKAYGFYDPLNYLCQNPVQAVRLELDSEITVEPNPVIQGKPVTIRAKISNRGGTKDFRGNLFAAFHKKGDSYSSQFDITLEDKPLGKGQDYEYTFRDVINLLPGEYDLYIKGDDFQALPPSAAYLQNPITVRVISGDVGHSELSAEDKANKIFDRVEKDYPKLFSNRRGNTALYENLWFYRVYDYGDQTLYLAISKNGHFMFNNGKKWQDITVDFEAANTQICNG